MAYRAKTPEYVCECECGDIVFVRGDSLKSGYTRSCGCLAVEGMARARTHLAPARIPTCHPNKPHEADGLCASCYQRASPGYEAKWRRGNLLRSLRAAGLTEEQYETMLTEQKGRCAICGMEPSGRLHVDHDHDAGTARGLLCTNCNPGLGFFRDDPVLLRRAAEYLEEHTS